MKYCINCGAEINDNDDFCSACGTNQNVSNEVQFENQGYVPPTTNATTSTKSRGVAAVLCFFLGGFGVHRFYAGKAGSGIALLLCSILGLFLFFPLIITAIWTIVDFFMIICGGFKDGDGLTI